MDAKLESEMTHLKFYFLEGELINTHFLCRLVPKGRACVRGKSTGATDASGTFQWTAAVKSLCILVLKSKLAHLKGGNSSWPSIHGERGSLASSLDFALSKEVNWLKDMFGIDSHGTLIAARVFLRTNSNRKRPGPVVLSLNKCFLPLESIAISIDGQEAPDEVVIEALLGQIDCTHSYDSGLPKTNRFSFRVDEEKGPLVA